MQDQAGRVRLYYNKNTLWMLLFGQGRGEAVIHRPVWLEENSSRSAALHTVDHLIAEALVPAGQSNQRTKHLLDLGCGVGGSALWLAVHYPISVTGITLSPFQARSANRLAQRRGLSRRCHFKVADFTNLPKLDGITDAYAVESFSHGNDPATFFSQIGNLLPAGGRLILCDDFISETAYHPLQRRRWLSRFRDGWHLQSLLKTDKVLGIAAKRGFHLVKRINLTPYLRPTSALLYGLQRLLGTALRRTTWGSSLYGGSALQVCQKNGWAEYLFLVLEKR
jgi:cyclopropane fatty-acyl-phospholipid synthase-like methyltransferase